MLLWEFVCWSPFFNWSLFQWTDGVYIFVYYFLFFRLGNLEYVHCQFTQVILFLGGKLMRIKREILLVLIHRLFFFAHFSDRMRQWTVCNQDLIKKRNWVKMQKKIFSTYLLCKISQVKIGVPARWLTEWLFNDQEDERPDDVIKTFFSSSCWSLARPDKFNFFFFMHSLYFAFAIMGKYKGTRMCLKGALSPSLSHPIRRTSGQPPHKAAGLWDIHACMQDIYVKQPLFLFFLFPFPFPFELAISHILHGDSAPAAINPSLDLPEAVELINHKWYT